MKSLVETQNLNNSNNNFIQVFKGLILSFIFTLVLLFLFSVILTYTNIPEDTIAPVIIIITIISILIGASISTNKIRKNGIVFGGIIGIVYIMSLYLISSIVETGFFLNIYSIVMIILSILAGMIVIVAIETVLLQPTHIPHVF